VEYKIVKNKVGVNCLLCFPTREAQSQYPPFCSSLCLQNHLKYPPPHHESTVLLSEEMNLKLHVQQVADPFEQVLQGGLLGFGPLVGAFDDLQVIDDQSLLITIAGHDSDDVGNRAHAHGTHVCYLDVS
jgi:hypothetical protein